MFVVTDTAIDPVAMQQSVKGNSCGALVTFEGWIRDHNEGQAVARLEYEVYRPVAIKQGNKILTAALQRFEIGHAVCAHREGLLELSDVAVVVCVSSAHRAAAFDACRFIIDEVKTRLPIWKKEHYVSGISEWVNCQHCAQPK